MAKELTFYISSFNFLVLQKLEKVTITADIGTKIDKHGKQYHVYYGKIGNKEKIINVF